MSAKRPELPEDRTAMNFRARDAMITKRDRRPSAERYTGYWLIFLVLGAAAFSGCSSRRADVIIPLPLPSVITDPEATPLVASRDAVEALLKKMEAGYNEVNDYQAEMEIVFLQENGAIETERSLYTFKKPKWIRIDTLAPNPGMIIIFPDRNGKVFVKPQGLLSLFTFRLTLDDPLLETPANQQINQTHIGELIKNIRHSTTDQRRGPVSISETPGTIQIQVLAEDHFREGVETRYQFVINKESWLPVEVNGFTADGLPKGKIIFHNLRTNIDVPDDLFQLGW